MTITLRVAKSAADYDAFGALCRAYLAWSRRRYAELPWFVDEVFGHQSLDDELKNLAAKYGPPGGLTLLAELDGTIAAAGAYRTLSPGICEMKRLYVSDTAQGRGVGRQLAQALMAEAKTAGFTLMRLDTASLLTEAIALYRSLGFETCPPYHDYPAKLMPHLVFMERPL